MPQLLPTLQTQIPGLWEVQKCSHVWSRAQLQNWCLRWHQPRSAWGPWGEGSFCFWRPITSLVFWEGSLGLLAGSGNSQCCQAKYIKGLWQNPKRLRPRRTSVVEKHVSVQLWDPLQVGAQTCQREAFFSATSACRSFSTVTFNKAVSLNSLLCLVLCKQMKQINSVENKAGRGVSWKSWVPLS